MSVISGERLRVLVLDGSMVTGVLHEHINAASVDVVLGSRFLRECSPERPEDDANFIVDLAERKGPNLQEVVHRDLL